MRLPRISVRERVVVVIACAVFLGSLPGGARAQPPLPGDKVITAGEGVQFGIRDQPLLTVRAGTEIQVTEVRGKWIGGYIFVDGEKRLGWIRDSEIRRAYVPGEPIGSDDARVVALLRDLGAGLQADDQRRVRRVTGAGSRLRDVHLEHLQRLPHLLDLDLSGLPITDEGLPHVGACRGLQQLYLAETKITDYGLPSLRNLARLEVLSVAKTAVTGKSLARLPTLSDLRVLNCGYCAVSDADLAGLSSFPRLETLAVPHTQISDEGLVHLKAVPFLRVLNLDGTSVTGTGFDHLLGLSELRMLYVRECSVDPAHIDKLDDELAGLAIYD